MVNISSIFVKSPFKALHNHMDKVVESVAPLENFFGFLFLEDFLNLEDQTILNYYNLDLKNKKIENNSISKYFKKFKV